MHLLPLQSQLFGAGCLCIFCRVASNAGLDPQMAQREVTHLLGGVMVPHGRVSGIPPSSFQLARNQALHINQLPGLFLWSLEKD